MVPFLMPAKSGDHAVTIAFVLDLEHDALVGLVGSGNRFCDNAIEASTFDPNYNYENLLLGPSGEPVRFSPLRSQMRFATGKRARWMQASLTRWLSVS